MGIALDILKTAALVGANLVQNQVQPSPQVPEKPGIMDMLKKNASKVFGLLFLRDIIRSLLVTMFLGLAAMAATSSLENEGLFRAAFFFTLAVFVLVCALVGVAAAMVRTLGFHKDAKDSHAQGEHGQIDMREVEAALDRAYSEGYAQGRMQAQGAVPAFGQPRANGTAAQSGQQYAQHGQQAQHAQQSQQRVPQAPHANSHGANHSASSTVTFGAAQGAMQGSARPLPQTGPQSTPQGQAGLQGNARQSPNSDAPRH